MDYKDDIQPNKKVCFPLRKQGICSPTQFGRIALTLILVNNFLVNRKFVI